MSKVLLADDSETMGKIIHIAFKGFPLNFKQTINAKETEQILEEESFDFILLSSTLKEVNSLNDLKKIKRLAPKSEILLLTSEKDKQTLTSYKEEGFHAILSKPFSKQDLLFALKSLGLSLFSTKPGVERYKIESTPVEKKSFRKNPELEDLFPSKENKAQPNHEIDVKDLENTIIQSLLDPNKTFMKILKHMMKEEMMLHSKDVLQQHCQTELKGIICDYLRGELKSLSDKKENITSL